MCYQNLICVIKAKIVRQSNIPEQLCIGTAVINTHIPKTSLHWLGLAPATLEFWVRFPNERNQGKQGETLC
jgi:hypothetical protein